MYVIYISKKRIMVCFIKLLLVKSLLMMATLHVSLINGQSPPPPPTTTTVYTQPEDYEYDDDTWYMYSLKFSDMGLYYIQIDGNFCSNKYVCESDSNLYQNYPERNCYCDSLCAVLRDCCPGYSPPEAEVPPFSPEVFDCVRMEDAVKTPGIGVTMVTRCDPSWPEGQIKTNCEMYDQENNTLLSMPVSEPTNNILFRNMYCSICNTVYEYRYWTLSARCRNSTGVNIECIWEYASPFPKKRNRMCPLGDIVDSCDEGASPEAEASCRDGSYAQVYYRGPYMAYRGYTLYRNHHCALCSGARHDYILCEDAALSPPLTTPPIDPKRTYSFRMLVDFNSGHLENLNGKNVQIDHNCRDNEMYDPRYDKCREILCPDPLVAKQGRCMYNTGQSPEKSSPLDRNCTLTKLDPGEFEFTNDSRVRVFTSGKVYSAEEFQMSSTDVFVCMVMNKTCEECNTGVMFKFDEAEQYLSLVTLIISLVALVITFIVYVYFNELLNTPGKILLSLVISLFFAQLMFLISPAAQPNKAACTALSVLMHYFFLAAFCWMNIVALDLWMTFSNQFISPGSGSKSIKRFLQFSVYGWCTPLVIVCIALIVDNSDIDEDFSNLKPRYGVGVCWIASREGLLLFFAGPLALFKLFDFVAFIFTSIHIFRAKKQGAMARQKPDVCSFLINIKLSLVMGLTWVFAFLANIGNISALWYLFIIFNCLQGLFIAISFLCTNKVQRLVRNKYEEVSGSKGSTQLSTLTPSNEQKV